MKNGFDLSQLDTKKAAEDGFTLRLLHPRTGEALPVELELLGVDSEICQRTLKEQQRKRLAQAVKSRRMAITPEELEAEGIELLAAATRGWKGMQLDGKPVEFSNEAARLLYMRFPWIREQVDQAISDRANFLPAFSKH